MAELGLAADSETGNGGGAATPIRASSVGSARIESLFMHVRETFSDEECAGADGLKRGKKGASVRFQQIAARPGAERRFNDSQRSKPAVKQNLRLRIGGED